jgi:hypothetical protein
VVEIVGTLKREISLGAEPEVTQGTADGGEASSCAWKQALEMRSGEANESLARRHIRFLRT